MKNKFTVTIHGARGTIAASSTRKLRYGSNTSCLEINVDNRIIIIDMGTGCYELGKNMITRPERHATILISHFHYDHVQGIPTFAPFFNPSFKFDVYSETRRSLGVKAQLESYMSSPYYPITPSAFTADIKYHDFSAPSCLLINDDIKISTMRSNHPDISTAFKISWNGKSLVYLIDYEHPQKGVEDFVFGADLLFYDAQYTPSEYPNYVGFGHSTWEAGVQLAKQCCVKSIVLFHHDPSRSDEKLDIIGQIAKSHFTNCEVAQEGRVFSL